MAEKPFADQVAEQLLASVPHDESTRNAISAAVRHFDSWASATEGIGAMASLFAGLGAGAAGGVAAIIGSLLDGPEPPASPGPSRPVDVEEYQREMERTAPNEQLREFVRFDVSELVDSLIEEEEP